MDHACKIGTVGSNRGACWFYWDISIWICKDLDKVHWGISSSMNGLQYPLVPLGLNQV